MKGFVALLSIFLLAACAQARPDLNAFLNKRASNLHELIREVRNDREVMDRYCRHYQMTPTQVLAFLKQLKPGMIMKPELYTVYSVPEGGVLKRHFEVLKHGTPVYLGPDGKPELIAKCGNPLRGPTPQVDLSVQVTAEHDTVRDIEPDPIFVSEIAAPDAEPPLLETTVETPAEEIITAGDSAIPIAGLSATSLLFPVSLFGVTTFQGGGSDTPSPAAAIPFIIGGAWIVRRRKAGRSGRRP